MANVKFKIGTQEALNTILNTPIGSRSIDNGAFYLTSDTHRLYIGGPNNALDPIGQGIKICSTINDLPSIGIEQGQFYYVSTPNILCIRSGDNWVQINPDTTYSITAVGQGTSAANGYSISLDNGGTNSTAVNFYSTTQVDTKINAAKTEIIQEAQRTINAMQYKGVVDSSTKLNTIIAASDNCIGDTYIVSVDGISYNNKTYNRGDLLILNGTETNGVITSDLTINGIPAATYQLNQVNNEITLIGPNNTNCGTATFVSTPLTWIEGFSN